jgi:hypothetical protein
MLEQRLQALHPGMSPGMARATLDVAGPQLSNYMLTPDQSGAFPQLAPNTQQYFDNYVMQQAAAQYAAQQAARHQAERQRVAEEVRQRIAQEQAQREAEVAEQAGREMAAATVMAGMNEAQRTLGDQRLRPTIPYKPAAQNIPSAHHLQAQAAAEAARVAAQPQPVKVLPSSQTGQQRDPSWPDWYQHDI